MIRFLTLLVFIPIFSISQNNTQNIRGVVTDKLSQTPLIGVIVQINSLQKGSNTDSLGIYLLSNVPPDRYDLQVTCIGYKNITIPNVLVTF